MVERAVERMVGTNGMVERNGRTVWSNGMVERNGRIALGTVVWPHFGRRSLITTAFSNIGCNGGVYIVLFAAVTVLGCVVSRVHRCCTLNRVVF
jgi:hypothetical protein